MKNFNILTPKFALPTAFLLAIISTLNLFNMTKSISPEASDALGMLLEHGALAMAVMTVMIAVPTPDQINSKGAAIGFISIALLLPTVMAIAVALSLNGNNALATLTLKAAGILIIPTAISAALIVFFKTRAKHRKGTL